MGSAEYRLGPVLDQTQSLMRLLAEMKSAVIFQETWAVQTLHRAVARVTSSYEASGCR